jgi:HipA-like C-terminal domain
MYPITDVLQKDAIDSEDVGARTKFWVEIDGKRQLVKVEDRNTGEDWAEKISCELAELVGLPHAFYNLARIIESEEPKPGVLSQSFAEPPLTLELGNQLLLKLDVNYPSEGRYRVSQHTINAVFDATSKLKVPLQTADESTCLEGGADFFVGYLLFDTWIANQDRHHQNWGALRNGNSSHLAPTFDHGAALARNLSSKERSERMISKDGNRSIKAFAERARSALYESTESRKPLSTFDAFICFAKFAPSGAAYWQKKICNANTSAVENIINQVPSQRMDEETKKFTLQLLQNNQARIASVTLGT